MDRPHVLRGLELQVQERISKKQKLLICSRASLPLHKLAL